MPTEFELQILRQADAIRAREGQAELDVDYGALADWYEQYGTHQQAEQARARAEGREYQHEEPNPLGSTGGMVPPHEMRDAATGQRLAPVPPTPGGEPGQDDTMPVRESDSEVESYDEWTKDDLSEEAAVRGLPKSGNKADLVERLREDDTQYASVTSGKAVEGDDTPPE